MNPSKKAWEMPMLRTEKVQETLAGNDVFRPLSESDCPLVKK